MPQDPAQNLPEIGPGGGRPGASGPGYAERQFEAQAYEAGGATGQQAGLLGASLGEAFSRIPDVRKARYQGLNDALREYTSKQQGLYDAEQRRMGLGSALTDLKKTQGVGVMADKFAAGLFTPILGGVDTALDVGANLGNTAGTLLGGGQLHETVKYADDDVFLPGPGLGTQALSGVRPKPRVESGFLESVTGESTPAAARVSMARRPSPLSGPQRAQLIGALQEDMRRAQNNEPRILTDEEVQQIQTLDDPGLAGLAGDLIAMGALTPTRVAGALSGLASRFLPGAAATGLKGVVNRAAGAAIGGGATYGATRALTEQDAQAGLNDLTFGAGMEGTGSFIDSAMRSKNAQRLLAASSIARNAVTRYLGRTAAETAKLRAGRVASAAVNGNETPMEALTADPLGELGAAGAFSLFNGRPMGRVEQRVRANRSGQAMVRAGEQQREARGAARNLREAFDIAGEVGKKDRATVASAESREARVAAEQKFESELAGRTESRLQELGQEIQRGLDNKEARDFQEATKGLRERLARMDAEVAAEQAKKAEDDALARQIEQEGNLRQLQAQRQAAGATRGAKVAPEPQDTLRTLASLETPARAAKVPGQKRATKPLDQAEIEWAKKVNAEVQATGRALTRAERKKIAELGERYEANQPKPEQATPVVAELQPTAAPATSLGGTAAPSKATAQAKPGRKPRAFTPDEQAWAREMSVKRSRGEQLTAAEKRKLKALTERGEKAKAYEEAQRQAEQAKQEAASSPDPRARLSDKGKAMVDQYVAAIQKSMDDAAYLALREQFIRKMKQKGKWSEDVAGATPEVRASEVDELLNALDREAPESVKKAILGSMTGKRKMEQVKADRRAAGREEKLTVNDVVESGLANKSGEAEAVSSKPTPAEEAVLNEAFGRAERLSVIAESLEPKAFQEWLRTNRDAVVQDIEAGRIDAIESVLNTLPKRAPRSSEAGFALGGSPLGPLVKGLYNLVRRGVVDFARLSKWAAKGFPGTGKAVRDFFARIFSGFGSRSMLRQAANYHVGQAHDAFVNLTPEGRAKDAAKQYANQFLTVAEPARVAFEEKVYPAYAKAITEANKELASKATESVTANGSEWHRLEAELMGYIPPSAELAPLREAYKKYAAETWNVSDDLGLTHPTLRGKKVDPNGPGYLLQPLSLEMRSELGLPYETPRVKALRAHLKTMPENAGVPAKEIDAAFDAARAANSNDVAARTSAEKKNAIEFVRRITWPGRFDGIDVTVAKPSDVIRMHHRGLASRVGFEKAFAGRELKDMRKEFADLGGDPTRFDRFIEAAQGQNPRYSDWASKIIAENPGFYGWVRGLRSAMRLDSTLDLTASAVSAMSDFAAGPGVHLFGRRYYQEAVKAGVGQAKLVLGLDKRTAAEIATSAQELHQRSIDMSRNLNATRGERVEHWNNLVSQHLGAVAFRHVNRGAETVITKSFLGLADDLVKAIHAGKRIARRDVKAIDRVARHFGWDAATKQRFSQGRMTQAELRANTERLVADLTGQTQNPMFRSAAQKNPLLHYLVRFASHATQQQRITIRAMKEWGQNIAAAKGTDAKLKAIGFESLELGKFLGQQTAKGVALLMMKALLQGDNVNPWSDDSTLWAKVKNDPLSGIPGMIGDALWSSAVLGPYAMALSGLTGADSPIIQATSSMSPSAGTVGHLAAQTGVGQFVDGVLNFWTNPVGPYRDTGDLTTTVAGVPVPNPTTLLERAKVMVEKRIPGTRQLTNLAVMAGLAAGNKDLDNAASALYRWRQANDRMKPLPGESVPDPEHAAMRRELRDALKEMASGRSPGEGFARALQGKGEDAGRLAAALRARKQLTPQRGIVRAKKRGEPETDLESIRREMGDEQFRTLVLHDELLEAWATMLVEKKGDVAKNEAQVERQIRRLKPLIENEATDTRIRSKAAAAAERTLRRLP